MSLRQGPSTKLPVARARTPSARGLDGKDTAVQRLGRSIEVDDDAHVNVRLARYVHMSPGCARWPEFGTRCTLYPPVEHGCERGGSDGLALVTWSTFW